MRLWPFRVEEWAQSLASRTSQFANRHPELSRRMRATVLIVALLVAGKFAIEAVQQWIGLGRYPLSLDFSLYRASAIQGLEFGWNHLYDLNAQMQVYNDQLRANPSLGPMGHVPNVYPPPASWLAVPFTFLSVQVGYLIWSLLIFASTVFAFLTLVPGDVLAKVLQFALAFCPFVVLWSVAQGQVTSFQIAGIAACWLALKRGHDGWAGIALLPLVLKPQTLLLVPLTLLVAGRIRTFTAWVISTAAVGLAVLANIGFDGAISYFHRLQYVGSHSGEYLLGPVYTLTLHFTTRLGRYGAEIMPASLALWVAWRHRHMGPEVPIAAGLIGSVLVATYLHINDMLTLFPAAWLILRAHPRWWLWILMGGGYVVALLCTGEGTARWGEALLLFEISVLTVLAVVVRVTQLPANAEADLSVPVRGVLEA